MKRKIGEKKKPHKNTFASTTELEVWFIIWEKEVAYC